MKSKRKIFYVTGSRADYGVTRSTLNAIRNHPKLDLSLIVTGMHMSHKFGHTVDEIEKDDFKILAKTNIFLEHDSKSTIAQSIGRCIVRIGDIFANKKPDIVLIQGDRGEMLAVAIAATYMNIPIAHMSGGDITTGTIDNLIRDNITKLSHIHFPSTLLSAKRLTEINREEVWRIHHTGNPGINLKSEDFTESSELIKKIGIDSSLPIFIVIQHPVIGEAKEAQKNIETIMDTIVELKEQTIVIYPNADIGCDIIIKTIQNYQTFPFIKLFKNLDRKDFIGLMRIADVIIGNSSCGIVEASSLNMPAVNIGTRQNGREKPINVIDVKYNKNEIKEAIKKTLYDKDFKEEIKNCFNPYICEGSEGKIVDVLSNIEISQHLLTK